MPTLANGHKGPSISLCALWKLYEIDTSALDRKCSFLVQILNISDFVCSPL